MLSVPQDVFDDAYAYLIVIFLGIPFTLLYNLLSSILRSVGDSRTPFLFLAISTVLNIGLDLLCIIVFKWGVAGAAIATIAAQAVSGILCLIYIRFRVPLLTLSRADCKADAESIRDLVVMGIPMGLQTSITAIGSMVMQAANNGLGSVYVSGFTAGMRLKQFCMCPFDALGSAVSVFCGQNLGAKKPERIRQGVRLGVIVGVAYGFCIGLVMIFFGRSMSTLFVESSARRRARRFRKISALHGLLLLESRHPQHLPYGDTGHRLLRPRGILRRNGNVRALHRQPRLCRRVRLYGYLFLGSNRVDRRRALHHPYLPALH